MRSCGWTSTTRRIDWRLADGEAEIAPGITAVPTYGHTPGHQSFVVELDESRRAATGSSSRSTPRI